MRDDERIAGLRELAARQQRYRTDLQAHHEQATEFVESGADDAERATELLERLAQLQAEEAAILAELRRLDPALTAGMN